MDVGKEKANSYIYTSLPHNQATEADVHLSLCFAQRGLTLFFYRSFKFHILSVIFLRV